MIAGMRSSVACCAILASFVFAGPALATDVQLGDSVMALRDGIGCDDWGAYEKTRDFEDRDPRTLQRGDLPEGCRFVHAPLPLTVQSIKLESNAVCVRLSWSPNCFWFSIQKVRAMLRADQRRV